MTGESDEIKKRVADDCYLIGNTLVRGGSGVAVVTAVGENARYGEIIKGL